MMLKQQKRNKKVKNLKEIFPEHNKMMKVHLLSQKQHDFKYKALNLKMIQNMKTNLWNKKEKKKEQEEVKIKDIMDFLNKNLIRK